MQKAQSRNSITPVMRALTLVASLALVACGSSGSSSTSENETAGQSDTTGGESGTDTGGEAGGTAGTNGNGTDTTSGNTGATYLDASGITTNVQPSFGDSGLEYELLGYRLHGSSILAMDLMATNISDVVKTRGNCSGDTFKDDELVAFSFTNFLSGAPLRPNDEMVTSIFFREVSDPSQIDMAEVNCNYADLEKTGNDPAVTYDFIEFTEPDSLGRILIRVQVNNDSGEIIKFARCDFSARNGNRIVENARIDFNLGPIEREILPGEAYIGEGILVLDFDEFESDSFDPADLHCDYNPD